MRTFYHFISQKGKRKNEVAERISNAHGLCVSASLRDDFQHQAAQTPLQKVADGLQNAPRDKDTESDQLLYLLVPSVDIPKDPTVLPSDDAIYNAAMDALLEMKK